MAAEAPGAPPGPAPLAAQIDALLPQTQCRRCGYPDCAGYARAIASGEADINRCPPGGAQGIERLAMLLQRPALPLDPACGCEGPRRLAAIDPAQCIGCALCIQACPVDAIAGVAKRMHTVIARWCTGCELCLPACPVDCIRMGPLPDAARPEATGWNAWSPELAAEARGRYAAHAARHAAAQPQGAPADDRPTAAAERKAALLKAALERARRRLAADSHE